MKKILLLIFGVIVLMSCSNSNDELSNDLVGSYAEIEPNPFNSELNFNDNQLTHTLISEDPLTYTSTTYTFRYLENAIELTCNECDDNTPIILFFDRKGEAKFEIGSLKSDQSSEIITYGKITYPNPIPVY